MLGREDHDHAGACYNRCSVVLCARKKIMATYTTPGGSLMTDHPLIILSVPFLPLGVSIGITHVVTWPAATLCVYPRLATKHHHGAASPPTAPMANGHPGVSAPRHAVEDIALALAPIRSRVPVQASRARAVPVVYAILHHVRLTVSLQKHTQIT